METESKSINWPTFFAGILVAVLIIGPQRYIEQSVTGWVVTYYGVRASFEPPIEMEPMGKPKR